MIKCDESKDESRESIHAATPGFVEILSICWKCKMKNDQKQRFIEILMKMKVS
jgi:hypothetical protein